ncbi:unnamed protein product, partial [marine sediment metagenome]
VLISIALIFLSTLFIIGLSSTADANPHRMLIAYQVGSIDLDVYFSGGAPAQNAHITVYRPDETIYLEGETDEEGEFSFEPPVTQGEYRVVAEHSGHMAEVSIGGEGQGGSNEIPLYITVVAGLGYLIGIGGAAVGYIGWKARRKRESETPS